MLQTLQELYATGIIDLTCSNWIFFDGNSYFLVSKDENVDPDEIKLEHVRYLIKYCQIIDLIFKIGNLKPKNGSYTSRRFYPELLRFFYGQIQLCGYENDIPLCHSLKSIIENWEPVQGYSKEIWKELLEEMA